MELYRERDPNPYSWYNRDEDLDFYYYNLSNSKNPYICNTLILRDNIFVERRSRDYDRHIVIKRQTRSRSF